MMDAAFGSTTPTLVVGRTLSSLTVAGLVHNQETVTYTVYNEQADPETGILLTTTLQPGVTFASASSLPDRSGQDLAWSLGTIEGYDRVSVSMTVTLATPAPMRIDGGARAYAFLDGGMVGNLAPAATLSTLAVPSGTLNSTPDANATDPYIQEEAAKLDYDPQQIFDFLHTQVGYNSYIGSLRGARGTLWSDAGNALDVASLGVALMRASGIPAQYVSGTLTQVQAQSLILSMFPASDRTVGYIPPGTTTSDPADDPQLLSETENHDWFQFETAAGFKDADPLISGATIGQTFATATGTFAEVAQDLRQTTEIKLSVETSSQAAGAFGLGGGLSRSIVLDQTMNDVDLVGRSLSVGNFVSQNSLSALGLSSSTTTYTPYVIVAGDSFNPTDDETISGQSYQDMETNFPLGSQIVTGLFLEVDLKTPGQAVQSFNRTLADRIGIAARASGEAVSISSDPNSSPLISPLDVATISVMPSQYSPAALNSQIPIVQAMEQQLTAYQAQVLATPAGDALDAIGGHADAELRAAFIAMARSRLAEFDILSDSAASTVETASLVQAYLASPRITILSSDVAGAAAGSSSLQFSVDLLKDDIRAIPDPGNTEATAIGFNIARGLDESAAEADALGNPPALTGSSLTVIEPSSASSIFEAAQAQSIPFVVLALANQAKLEGLAIPADAKALISQELALGQVIIVPAGTVTVAGQTTIAWYQVDPTTGNTVGVLPSGQHQALFEYNAARLSSQGNNAVVSYGFGVITGLSLGNFEKAAIFLLEIELAQIFPQAILTFKQVLSLIKNSQAILAAVEDLFSSPTTRPFAFGFLVGLTISGVVATDPPVGGYLSDPDVHFFPSAPNNSQTNLAVAPSLAGGSIQGRLDLPNLQARGALQASWTSSASSAFQVSGLAAPSAEVRDSKGVAIGTGAISLGLAGPIEVGIGGNVDYQVVGEGGVSFCGPSEASLGVGGEWTSYSASLGGEVYLTLTTAGLTLNGKNLPAGTYTILTSAASIAGSGSTSSPNFAAGATISSTSGSISLGASMGQIQIGGKAVNVGQGLALSGYTGLIEVAANGHGLDTVLLEGMAANVLGVAAPLGSLTADQNTPVAFTPSINTSLSDSYSITAEGPVGWSVAIEPGGQVTVTPAPGTQSGTYPIQILVQSASDLDLTAQTTVEVGVTPTLPAITLAVTTDPVLTVGIGPAEIRTAYRASVENLGPLTDTYNLAFTNVPAGFAIASSGTSLRVVAGRTGILGVYLQLGTGQDIPTPGTQLSFTVIATSTTNSAITKTQVVTFTVPAIDALSIISNPTTANTTPGLGLTSTITITNVGNVAENNVTLSSTTSAGLTLTGLAPVSLAVGQSITETVTITAAASVPLNSLLQATITATEGTSGSTQTLTLPVDVVVPGATAIANASGAASQLGLTDLANRLNDLSTAITNLVQNPTSPVFNGQSVAELNAISLLVGDDPFLAPFASFLTADGAALAQSGTAITVQAALAKSSTDLAAVSITLNDEVQHGFTLTLLTNTQVALPQTPRTFSIALQNIGNATTIYDLSISGLPAGVTATFSDSSITLDPGEDSTDQDLTVTLTSTSSTAVPAFTFMIGAVAEGAPEIARATTGSLTARAALVSVVSVVTHPPFTEPGGMVDVTARILNAVNQEQTALVSFVVTDSTNRMLYTSRPVSTTLGVLTSLFTVDLGSFSTTGFSKGDDTISIVITTNDGTDTPLPGMNAIGSLLIGSPVTATTSVTPDNLPTGSGTVTNSLTVALNPDESAPLNLIGEVDPAGGAIDVAIYGNVAYVGGNGQINDVDVTDPTHPTVTGSFASTDFPSGAYVSDLQVANGSLYVELGDDQNVDAQGDHQLFLIYSLANPSAPTLTGKTPVSGDTGFDNFVLSDDHAYLYAHHIRYFIFGNSIFHQFGQVSSVDISNPADPVQTGSVYNQPPDPNSGFPDGESNFYGALAVNSGTLLAATTTATGSTVTGTGEILSIDTSNPSAPAVVNTLQVPGTTWIISLAMESGNRALAVASTGGFIDGGSDTDPDGNLTFGPSGNLVLVTLDLSNPRSPQVLSTQLLSRVSREGNQIKLLALGGDKFVLSSLGAPTDQPDFLFIDASGSGDAKVSVLTIPTVSTDFKLVGNDLYTTSDSGLLIYNVGSPSAETPVTVDVKVPTGSGVSIVPNSFNIAPTSITPGAGFETIEWTLNLDQTTMTQTFTYMTQVTGLQAGESLAVTEGATVGFTSQGTQGSVALAPLAVAGQQFIGIFPSSETAQPGQTVSYFLELKNPTTSDVTYNLAIAGIPASWTTLPATVSVPAGGENDFDFDVTSSASSSPGVYGFTVTASTTGGTSGSSTSSLTVQGVPIEPDPESHGIVATLIPVSATAGQGTSAHYIVRLTNTGSADDTFLLSFSPSQLLAGVAASFGETTIDVPPGLGNFRDIPLTLTPTAGTKPGLGSFSIQVLSRTNTATTSSATGMLNVVANGVTVGLSPTSNAPGSTFPLTVTNTGSVTDTFDLSLGGPAALVSSLGSSKVRLAPGASVVVPITTSAVNFAVQGGLGLTAFATSEGNATVSAGASSSLAIPATTGMTSQLTPSVQLLPIPGTTSFLLIVQNTGNVEDSYIATLTGNNGPIMANLMGLDGRPTQSIPIFRLPGLSTGEIVIQANLLGVGLGTVSVQVKSLTNGAMVASETATVSSIPATTLQLLASTSQTTVGQPVTFAAIVAAPGSLTPSGSVTFVVDGVAQAPEPVSLVNGSAVASFTTSTLGAGTHQISAVFNGIDFAQSSAGPVALVVNPAIVIPAGKATSSTALFGPTSSITVGQVLTLTAVVSTTPGSPSPTGAVVFVVNGVAEAPSPVVIVNGLAEAVLSLFQLPAGLYGVAAAYIGDLNTDPSSSAPLPFAVVAPTIAMPSPDGPQVINIQRHGYHAMPTTYVLTFNESLDPALAQDTLNYRIVGPKGVVETIDSAVYDASAMTVTLHPHNSLDLHALYQITINGTGPSEITNLAGARLDGTHSGQPGGDDVATLKASDLILGSKVPGGPKALAKLRKELAQIEAAQAKELAKKPPAPAKKVVSKVVHPSTKSTAKTVFRAPTLVVARAVDVPMIAEVDEVGMPSESDRRSPGKHRSE